tara:strand:+ start:3563 stop:4360 length:798 start_codon:yes stop_codon:yes gene_type:complete
MGFKLPGKSIQSGTSAHSSALKMVAEQRAASALKAKETDWAAMHAKANKKYNRYKGLTTEEYKTEALRQSAHHKKTGKWDAGGVYNHDGSRVDKGTKNTTKNTTTKTRPTVEEKGETKKANIQTKADVKKSEVDENVSVREAKENRKYARQTFGRGSAEHATTKVEVSKAKGEDMAGAKGGKKATVLGNLRRKLNKQRTEKLEKKAIKKAIKKDKETEARHKKEQEILDKENSPNKFKTSAGGHRSQKSIEKRKKQRLEKRRLNK